MMLKRGAAALIEIPGKQPIVVVSVHFKCCGYAGSEEDVKRIKETDRLVQELAETEGGKFGEKAAEAGVVVIGDYNLVGSRKPLTNLIDNGLEDFLLRSPADGSATTWQGLRATESFWPGRLDYVTFRADRLEAKGGYKLSASELQLLRPKLKVPKAVSDHSMLVIDVAPRE